tara:strand:+ start:1131 stop:1532 length:402 start_codon:yes stop_codon:yes gene_type:complete
MTVPYISALDHLVLTVANIAQTVAFYHDVLGMQALQFSIADGSKRWALVFGAQKINLHLAGAAFAPHAVSPSSGSADLCFLSPTPLANWQAHLATHGVDVIDGPVARSGALGPIQSLYIRDLDGNLLEISNVE